jgi:head-tail adaptor
MPVLWPKYNPGELRHIVQIVRQSSSVDGLGQPKNEWPVIWTCRAAIDDAIQEIKPTGREFYQDGLIAARITHVITIRWARTMPQIFPGNRVYYTDQRYSPPAIHTYFIEFIENSENRDVILRLGCWEINAPG